MTLKIRNWDTWQSYRKDRGQPPWIKIHRRLMRHQNWVSLTDAQRGQLVAIWMLAADRHGVIPASPVTLKKLCFMDSEPDINLLIEKEFIEPDAKLTPTRRHDDQPEENRIEKNREGREYFFESGTIKLSEKDFLRWKSAFSNLNLEAELCGLSGWATEEARKGNNWFNAVSGALAKRNRQHGPAKPKTIEDVLNPADRRSAWGLP